MLLQFLSCLYSVLPICLSLLHALFSHFTASLPNLTVRVLIRRSVSQAVLSFCLNIHLLSVYLHLRKNLPRLACAVLPLLSFLFYLSVCLAYGFSILSIVLCFVLTACLTSLFSHSAKRFMAWFTKVFLSKRQMDLENVSHPVACCKLAASLLYWLFHTYFTTLQTHRVKQRGGGLGGVLGGGDLKRGRKSQ